MLHFNRDKENRFILLHPETRRIKRHYNVVDHVGDIFRADFL